MKWFLTYMRGLLHSPSSYRAQPWAYARNQIGHGAVGALWFDLSLRLPLLAALPIMAVGVVGYVVWEFWQWRNADAEAWDNFDDTANVMQWAMAAACLPYSSWLAGGVLAASLLGLVSGVLRRIDETAQSAMREGD